MPEPLWIYLMALLYFTNLTTCSAIADAFDSVSHDRLTRMLQGTWSGHILLDLALRLLFTVAGGYLIVDDTVAAKPYARLLGEAAWVWSNKDRKVLFGVSVVLLVWTDGQIRIPLAFRVWRKGGASKYDLALELLSYARNRLRCKPAFVLFDSWYPSKQLLKRIRDYGWYFVCQLKKTRIFEGRALRRYKQQQFPESDKTQSSPGYPDCLFVNLHATISLSRKSCASCTWGLLCRWPLPKAANISPPMRSFAWFATALPAFWMIARKLGGFL